MISLFWFDKWLFYSIFKDNVGRRGKKTHMHLFVIHLLHVFLLLLTQKITNNLAIVLYYMVAIKYYARRGGIKHNRAHCCRNATLIFSNDLTRLDVFLRSHLPTITHLILITNNTACILAIFNIVEHLPLTCLFFSSTLMQIREKNAACYWEMGTLELSKDFHMAVNRTLRTSYRSFHKNNDCMFLFAIFYLYALCKFLWMSCTNTWIQSYNVHQCWGYCIYGKWILHDSAVLGHNINN